VPAPTAGARVNLLVAILTLALLALAILVISAPLRAARRPGSESAEGGELDAAREAKYREIRDAELDYRTGKLSRSDYEAIDGALRAEAVEILNRLEALEGGDTATEEAQDGETTGDGERSVRAAEDGDAGKRAKGGQAQGP
jgi:hypothetical protein